MLTVTTCGKLYLAGEYAVLTPGYSALIKNIEIRMTASISKSKRYKLVSDMFDYAWDLSPDPNTSYDLLSQSVLIMEEYLTALGYQISPFHLDITGKMEKEGKKIGIGSSGSVVILTLKAMAALYQIELTADDLFRLASYILIKRGDNGSMGDLACIAYEQLIYYRSFDRENLAKLIAKESLLTVLNADWHYEIIPIKSALPIQFLVGWTKRPAISSQMISQVKEHIDVSFLRNMEKAVQGLRQSLVNGNKKDIIVHFNQASDLLENLSNLIYTKKLQELKDATIGIDAIAKSSGAGGGDCGIALAFEKNAAKKVITAWSEKNIDLLYQSEL